MCCRQPGAAFDWPNAYSGGVHARLPLGCPRHHYHPASLPLATVNHYRTDRPVICCGVGCGPPPSTLPSACLRALD